MATLVQPLAGNRDHDYRDYEQPKRFFFHVGLSATGSSSRSELVIAPSVHEAHHSNRDGERCKADD
jgi:hypothetical protein